MGVNSDSNNVVFHNLFMRTLGQSVAENLSFLFGGLKGPPTSKKDKLREPVAVEAAAAAGGG